MNFQKAQETFQMAQDKLAQAGGRKQIIEANLTLKRAKANLLSFGLRMCLTFMLLLVY